MKKLIKFLLPFLVASSALFSGCDKPQEKEEKIRLTYSEKRDNPFITDLSASQIKTKIDHNENLMVAIKPDHCSCWDDFKNAITPYLKAHKMVIYQVSYDDFLLAANNYGLTLTKGNTTFAIFAEGKLAYSTESDPENTVMRNPEKLAKVLDAKLGEPFSLNINEDELKQILASDKNAVVYFKKSSCPDCTYAEPSLLIPYLNTHKNANKFYVMDIQPWNDDLSPEEYSLKKDEYKLSSINNEDFGYGAGAVPYFQLIEAGQITSAAMVFNDSVKKVENKYIVEESFYSEERLPKLHYLDGLDGARLVLKGMELSPEQVNDGERYIAWEQTDAKNYYRPLLNAFLAYSLPKITFSF